VRQAVGGNRLFDLAGRGRNVHASQDDEGDGDQRDERGDNDKNDLHEHPANCQSRTAL
jgi:hypothetical protein